MNSTPEQVDSSTVEKTLQLSSMGVFIRGLAMGAADVVPGVSGGTIALITGIYAHLIVSIKRCTDGGLKLLWQGNLLGFWRHIDGTFLTTLALGIFLSILGLSQVIHYLLGAYPQLLWGFFFGLIVASSLVLFKHLPKKGWAECVAMILGFVFAFTVGLLHPMNFQATPVVVFLAGAIAICAMILPGISGSFLLVLMGLYHAIIGAIRSLDWVTLLCFASGCGFGLLVFSHVVDYLLSKYEALTLSALTGVMLGALIKVWPWQSQTDIGLFSWAPWILMPDQYAQTTGQSHLLFGVVLMLIIGIAVVLFFASSGKNFAK